MKNIDVGTFESVLKERNRFLKVANHYRVALENANVLLRLIKHRHRDAYYQCKRLQKSGVKD